MSSYVVSSVYCCPRLGPNGAALAGKSPAKTTVQSPLDKKYMKQEDQIRIQQVLFWFATVPLSARPGNPISQHKRKMCHVMSQGNPDIEIGSAPHPSILQRPNFLHPDDGTIRLFTKNLSQAYITWVILLSFPIGKPQASFFHLFMADSKLL